MVDRARPVYTIGTASEILQVHPRTLRLYEEGGLIRPARKNNRRLYSASDLEWISCVRYLIHERGLNQEGLRRLLALIPCSEIKGCAPEIKADCPAWLDKTTPCWDWARRTGDEDRRCNECDVYLSAGEYVLSAAERQEALRYLSAD